MSEFYPLTVKKIVDETSQSRSFVLTPQRSDLILFRYQPGQFLSFKIQMDTGLIERSYSISSAPCYDPDMTVCVKRVDNGRGSNWFNDQLKVGSTIMARAPAGRFTLDDGQSDLLIIAGGSGITPCISLIKHTLYETSRNVKLVYANQNSESIIYIETLNQLQKRFSERFACVHWLDDARGFMKTKDVLSFAKGYEKASVYICGPAQLMDMAEEVLMDNYDDQLAIKTERFISPDDVNSQESGLSKFTDNVLLSEFRLQYEGEIHKISLDQGQTLLQAALASDLDIPRSCTEGHCGTCIAKLIDGDVCMASTKALSKRGIERGHILLCQAQPSSDKPLFVNLDF